MCMRASIGNHSVAPVQATVWCMRDYIMCRCLSHRLNACSSTVFLSVLMEVALCTSVNITHQRCDGRDVKMLPSAIL